jgi:hypothetical protein
MRGRSCWRRGPCAYFFQPSAFLIEAVGLSSGARADISRFSSGASDCAMVDVSEARL